MCQIRLEAARERTWRHALEHLMAARFREKHGRNRLPARSLRAKRGHVKTFKGPATKSQGRSLALTVLHVPYSL